MELVPLNSSIEPMGANPLVSPIVPADDEQRKEADARENSKYFDAMSKVMKRYGKEP